MASSGILAQYEATPMPVIPALTPGRPLAWVGSTHRPDLLKFPRVVKFHSSMSYLFPVVACRDSVGTAASNPTAGASDCTRACHEPLSFQPRVVECAKRSRRSRARNATRAHRQWRSRSGMYGSRMRSTLAERRNARSSWRVQEKPYASRIGEGSNPRVESRISQSTGRPIPRVGGNTISRARARAPSVTTILWLEYISSMYARRSSTLFGRPPWGIPKSRPSWALSTQYRSERAVVRDARSHQRVGELQQNGSPPPKENNPLAMDPPRHTGGRA